MVQATVKVGLVLIAIGALVSLTGVGTVLGIPLVVIGVGLIAMWAVVTAVKDSGS